MLEDWGKVVVFVSLSTTNPLAPSPSVAEFVGGTFHPAVISKVYRFTTPLLLFRKRLTNSVSTPAVELKNSPIGAYSLPTGLPLVSEFAGAPELSPPPAPKVAP